MTQSIMLVDDHPVFIIGLRSLIFNEADMDICGEASDEWQAIKEIEAYQPDLVVTDLSLGTGSGLQLVKKINSRYPQIKILVASMHDEKLYAERCLRAGARGYINKQEAPSDIIEAIRTILSGSVYVSAGMNSLLLDRQLRGTKTTAGRLPEELLSDRELEVFRLIGSGLSTKKIANELSLSVKTIDTHKEHIKRKLVLKDSAEVVQRAVSWLLTEAAI